MLVDDSVPPNGGKSSPYWHPEQKLLRQFEEEKDSNSKILYIYTELEPCESCGNHIIYATYPDQDINVYYSWNYTQSQVDIKRKNIKKLQEKWAGGCSNK